MRLHIKHVLCLCALAISLCAGAQELKKSDIVLTKGDSPHSGRIVVSRIENRSDGEVKVHLINEYDNNETPIAVNPRGFRDIDITCNRVRAKRIDDPNNMIDIYYNPKPKENITEASPTKKKDAPAGVSSAASGKSPQAPIAKKPDIAPVARKSPAKLEEIMPDFNKYIESIPFYSQSSIEAEAEKIDEHINNLRGWKDRNAYIKEHRLNAYINANRDSIKQYSQGIPTLINRYLAKYKDTSLPEKDKCTDSISSVLNKRLALRTQNLDRLSAEINDTQPATPQEDGSLNWTLIGICIGIALLLLGIIIYFLRASKAGKKAPHHNDAAAAPADASTAIIVKRKTTSVLRKQSLDDVIGNKAYLEIDCHDFCDTSAVRRMYIKNTCIKDIYNMYAEDLRNPSKPKEDGCMVLGRWIYDEESHEYMVSLEHTVRPGDDAVFAEYELNFGGKIRLKVTEKLRKLRRDTDLQYDLTCWVHSHPGLGIFFSNSDSNVQMQLKHPTHPNFLTAMVIDILTPQQELGIFTFKRDSTIASKADLKKLYSLEEFYKWAVESERTSLNLNDYYNTLSDAQLHTDGCFGIELSNSAIIDMGLLAAEHGAGLTAMVHGFENTQGQRTESIACTITKSEAIPDNELIGCFVVATHCSIPSIRKTVAGFINKIKFILIYTTTDGQLTSIPVINQDICTDERYYGEQKLEDLKIWTRRKR